MIDIYTKLTSYFISSLKAASIYTNIKQRARQANIKTNFSLEETKRWVTD